MCLCVFVCVHVGGGLTLVRSMGKVKTSATQDAKPPNANPIATFDESILPPLINVRWVVSDSSGLLELGNGCVDFVHENEIARVGWTRHECSLERMEA